MRDITEMRETVKRILWFAGLWVAGVAVLMLVAYLLRLAVGVG